MHTPSIEWMWSIGGVDDRLGTLTSRAKITISICYTKKLGGQHIPLYFPVSFTIRSISSFDKQPSSSVIVMRWDFRVVFSNVETLRIAFATSAVGTPEGSNLPRRLLPLVVLHSPSYTWMSTPVRRRSKWRGSPTSGTGQLCCA